MDLTARPLVSEYGELTATITANCAMRAVVGVEMPTTAHGAIAGGLTEPQLKYELWNDESHDQPKRDPLNKLWSLATYLEGKLVDRIISAELRLTLVVIFMGDPDPPQTLASSDVLFLAREDPFAGTLFDQERYTLPQPMIRLVELPRPHGFSSYGPPHYRRWPLNRSTCRQQRGKHSR